MKTSMLLVAVLAVAPLGAAMAQDQTQLAAAQALVLPMMQEMTPGKAGEILTGCVLAAATPEEIASLAAAGAPSATVGAKITEILARPAATSCISAAAGQ
jgi:hypothetical protein